MHGRMILKNFCTNKVTKNISVLILCGLLSSCSVFYGVMCSTSILFTPSECEEKIFIPEAVIDQPYEHDIEIGEFVGLSAYYIVENPSWVTVTLMAKNQNGQLIPLITENDWKTNVTLQDKRPIIIAHLQGIPPKAGYVRVKIKATVGRTMCGTTDPVFVLQLKVRKAE